MRYNKIQLLKEKLTKNNLWEKQIELNRWDFIKDGNSKNTNLYFIEKGCVHVYFSEDTITHSMYFGFEGSLISDLTSFLSEEPSCLHIQCLKKTKAKVISKTVLNTYIENDAIISKLWIGALSELSLWHIEREKDLLCNSPKKRIERVLFRQPELFQKVPHKYIASYLRMSPESLSRIYNS